MLEQEQKRILNKVELTRQRAAKLNDIKAANEVKYLEKIRR